MKALIVSDTHGSHRNLERVIEKEQPLDLLTVSYTHLTLPTNSRV